MKTWQTYVCAAALTAIWPAAMAETLLDLYQLAQQADPQYRIAGKERDAAAEQRNQARSQLLPSIMAGASADKQWGRGLASDHTATGYSLSLKQALFNRPDRITHEQADIGTRKAEADYQAEAQDLIMRVASRYFAVLAAQEQVHFAKRNQEAILQQLTQARQRYDVGLIAITDVKEAEALHDLARADEIDAQNQLDIALESLREVINAEIKKLATLSPDMPLPQPDPNNAEEWIRTALEHNPQFIAARLGDDLAAKDILRNQAARLPTVDFTARHQYGDTDNDGFGGGYAHTNSLGVEVSVPLYLGGAIDSRIREAHVRKEQAQDRVEQSRRAIQRQARQAYLDVLAGISRVNALKQATASSKAANEATQAGFNVGTRTTVEVLNVQRDLLRAQRDYDRARYDYVVGTLRLKQAAGLLSISDLEAINAWLR